jgi:Cu(I)-responsive transcriptional regulator
MNIGEASKASGISAKMIRYYEGVGLIRPVDRNESGYRIYSAGDVHTLRFIRRARDLGFSVEKIRQLLLLWQDQTRHSADVKRLALGHIDELNQRIGELQSIADTLQTLVDCCTGDSRPDCPILANITSPT